MRKVEESQITDHKTFSDSAQNSGSQTRSRRSITRLVLADESGQVLPWVVLMMLVVLSVAALVVDLGRAMVIQRQLQASADAAALAAAETISGTSTTFETIATNYSSGTSGKNYYTGVSVGTPTVTALCLTTVSGWGISCTTSNGTVTVPNAVSVTETATVPTLFAGVFGKPHVTLSATSTAARARPMPYNIALIVDSTLSMSSTDSNCGNKTQMQCALTGIQQLLTGLSTSYDHVALFTFPNVAAGSGSPSGVAMTSSGTAESFGCTSTIPSSYEGVSYTYYSPISGYTPYLESIGGGQSYEPPYSGVAWAMPYTFPPKPTGTSGYALGSGTLTPTYQITPFLEDYNTTSGSTTTLNSSSNLVMAVGGKSGCAGIAPSSYDGNYGTYYPGALYAAQAALLKEQTTHANSTNVMIILGDGDATSPQTNGPMYSMPDTATHAETTYKTATTLTTSGYTAPGSYLYATSGGSYPSWNGECGQGVDAAQYAATYSSNNTLMFTIAYGALTSGCSSDSNSGSHKGISPCQALQESATQVSGDSTSPYFYSDYTATGGDSGCQANSDNSGLTAISDIYNAIAAKLSSARLIPNGTT